MKSINKHLNFTGPWQKAVREAIFSIADRLSQSSPARVTIAPAGAMSRLRLRSLYNAVRAARSDHLERPFMSRIEEVTPQALIDLYSLVSDDSQWAFLKLLGGVSLAEAPFLLTSQLTIPEQWRFSEMITGSEMMNRFFLFLQQEARRLARAQPSISDEEFDRQFHEQIKQAIETQAQHVGEAQQAILKQKRDRKSDPETVLRNVKICNLRKQDQKKWSYRRLAREFKMTPQAIGLVLKGEAKWRRLATSAK